MFFIKMIILWPSKISQTKHNHSNCWKLQVITYTIPTKCALRNHPPIQMRHSSHVYLYSVGNRFYSHKLCKNVAKVLVTYTETCLTIKYSYTEISASYVGNNSPRELTSWGCRLLKHYYVCNILCLIEFSIYCQYRSLTK